MSNGVHSTVETPRKLTTKPTAGPPVYYPPDHEMFTKKDARVLVNIRPFQTIRVEQTLTNDGSPLSTDANPGAEGQSQSQKGSRRRGECRRRRLRRSGRHPHLFARLLCHALRPDVTVSVESLSAI